MKMETGIEGYIGTYEASKIIGVHKYTLLRWIQKHKKDKGFSCPSYYLMGSHFKFKKSEISDFIEKSHHCHKIEKSHHCHKNESKK